MSKDITNTHTEIEQVIKILTSLENALIYITSLSFYDGTYGRLQI